MCKNILIICNTFYQILIALQLKSNNFYYDNVVVLITDKVPIQKIAIERLKKLKCFEDVLLIPSMSYCHREHKRRKILSDIHTIIKGKSITVVYKHRFDLFVFYNMDMTAMALYASAYEVNRNIECARFEEGILSYNNPIGTCRRFKAGNFIRRLLGKKSILQSTKRFYCCYPSLYTGNLKVVEIPKIKELESMGRELKIIFDLKDTDLIYKEKYIFFTSVYDFEGGEAVGELEVVRAIRDHVGNDNLLVKVHPRDNRTVYSDEDFHVDKNSKIPWEAIQLNIDCLDKVFITVNSGSVLSINMLIDPMPKTVFAYECCNYQANASAINTITNLKTLLNDDAYKKYLNNVFTINRVEEL